MNSRERVIKAINHKRPDRVPLDFGGTDFTGIHASVISKLRDYYGLANDIPVKVIEPCQMLGEIKEDLGNIIGIDCMQLQFRKNIFGFENNNWKEWKLFDGTPVLVPEKFNTKVNKDGSIFQYPEGDGMVNPSAVMPKEGYYFDLIARQHEIDEDDLNIDDNIEEFGLIDSEDLSFLKKHINHLYDNTSYAIIANIPGMSFGDVGLIPAPSLRDPKGIRDIEEWYISLATRKEYIYKVFNKQCDIGILNLKSFFETVNHKIEVVVITAADLGTQNGQFISNDLYKELFKPFHTKINNWIHLNTNCKTFIHTCGSVENLIPEFIKAGFDILNPVQISAKNMNPEQLKKKYGKDIVFWGGGINTQSTLPFGSKEEVENEVKKTLDVFSPIGGFVFSSVHNIQPNTPIKNIVTMIETIKKFNEMYG